LGDLVIDRNRPYNIRMSRRDIDCDDIDWIHLDRSEPDSQLGHRGDENAEAPLSKNRFKSWQVSFYILTSFNN
jgi:hypothetical protein